MLFGKYINKCHRKKYKTIILNLNVDQLNKMKINGLESLNNWEIVFNFFQLLLDTDGVKC